MKGWLEADWKREARSEMRHMFNGRHRKRRRWEGRQFLIWEAKSTDHVEKKVKRNMKWEDGVKKTRNARECVSDNETYAWTPTALFLISLLTQNFLYTFPSTLALNTLKHTAAALLWLQRNKNANVHSHLHQNIHLVREWARRSLHLCSSCQSIHMTIITEWHWWGIHTMNRPGWDWCLNVYSSTQDK